MPPLLAVIEVKLINDTGPNMLQLLFGSGIVVGLFAGIFGFIRELHFRREERKERLITPIREEKRKRLNEFFGPFSELRTQSRHLYNIFAVKQKAEASSRGDYFRTVTYLANGQPLSAGDQSLLKEILDIGEKQLELIQAKGWAISNPALSGLLGKLAAHIRILKLATAGNLKGMADVAEKMVFPLEVDGAIESELRRTQAEFESLLKPKPKTWWHFIPNLPDGTIQYYDLNAKKYYAETAFLDMSHLYKPFRYAVDSETEQPLLPRGALILDVGCGVGRDTRYFIQHGYRVVSIDASSGMVQICNEYPFAYCEHKDIKEINYLEEFDGVWACASLIHLKPEMLRLVLSKLLTALKPNGLLFFTLKEGTGSERDSGRRFYYYKRRDVYSILEEELCKLDEIAIWDTESRKESDSGSVWVNYLYKKKPVIDRVKGINSGGA